MKAGQKKLLLDLLGVGVAIALPALAAVSEFPKIQSATTGCNAFVTFLNISSTAFAVIAIISVLTAWRFFHERLKAPKSGFLPTVMVWAVARGVKTIIAPFETIMFWAAVGSGIALIVYAIADMKYGGTGK